MRRLLRILVGCLCLLLCLNAPCFAKEWRGIVPLKTTRSQVVKLIGEPKRTWETASGYFDLADGRATVEWIDPTCERGYPIYTAQDGASPDDLVLNIYVYPIKPIPMKELDLPDVGYMTLGCHPNAWCTLWSSEVGFGFTSARGGIDKLFYGPAEVEFKAWSNKHKACRHSGKAAA
jgi:hypothetical protein